MLVCMSGAGATTANLDNLCSGCKEGECVKGGFKGFFTTNTGFCCGDNVADEIKQKLGALQTSLRNKARKTNKNHNDLKNQKSVEFLVQALATTSLDDYLSGKWHEGQSCDFRELVKYLDDFFTDSSAILSNMYELFLVTPGAPKGVLRHTNLDFANREHFVTANLGADRIAVGDNNWYQVCAAKLKMKRY